MPIRWYRRWRHAGEEGALAIYAASCWGVPVLLAATAVGVGVILLRLGLPWIVPLSIAAATVHDLDNFRRAIIFTPTSVRFRPTFGRLREIPVKDIFLVRRAAVREGSSRTPMNVLAAELTLPYGETLLISLSMDKGEEALQRLIETAGTPPSNPAP
jgi:hypothetical protein